MGQKEKSYRIPFNFWTMLCRMLWIQVLWYKYLCSGLPREPYQSRQNLGPLLGCANQCLDEILWTRTHALSPELPARHHSPAQHPWRWRRKFRPSRTTKNKIIYHIQLSTVDWSKKGPKNVLEVTMYDNNKQAGYNPNESHLSSLSWP